MPTQGVLNEKVQLIPDEISKDIVEIEQEFGTRDASNRKAAHPQVLGFCICR